MFASIFLVVIGLLSIVALPLVVLWAASVLGSGAPFVPVPKEAIGNIVDALELTEDSVVYDMGCGDGRILLECVRRMPKIRAIGIERSFLPYLLARFYTRGTSVSIIRNDMFVQSINDATHVITYLFPEMMERVEVKIERELKPGAKLLAIDFPLPNRIPDRKVDALSNNKRGGSLSLYIL